MSTEAIVAMIEKLYNEEKDDATVLGLPPCAEAVELTMDKGVAIALAASNFFTMLALHDGEGCYVVYASNAFALEAVALAKPIKARYCCHQAGKNFDTAAIGAAVLEAALHIID